MDTTAEKKACPLCGETILTVAVKCKHCGSALGEGSTSSGSKRAAKTGRSTAGVFVLGLIYMLLLSFHVVIDAPTVIPKDGLRMSDTFVTVGELVERFNSASMIEKASLNQSSLYRSLKQKGLLVSTEQ